MSSPVASQPPAVPVPLAFGDTAERRIEVALALIGQADDFPALSRQMQGVLSELDGEALSAQQLTTIVLRDYSLTLKVLRLANSANHSRGQSVRTITHAMIVLGVKAVRRLAAGLILVDHFSKRSAGLKELMLCSLLTANHARELALAVGYAEPETAFLAGMVRNLGEVLVAAHFPEAYADTLRAAHATLAPVAPRSAPPARPDGARVAQAIGAAAERVLGFRLEALGAAMLARWGMSPELQRAVSTRGGAGATLLESIGGLAHDVTTLVYRADLPALGDASARPAEGPGVAALLDRHADRLRVGRDGLRAVLANAVSETREIFADAGVSLDSLRLARQTTAALVELGDAEGAHAHAAERSPAGAEDDAPRATDAGAVATLRAQLLQDVADTLEAAGGEPALQDVMLLLLESFLRGGPLDRALLVLVSPDRRVAEARLALGAGGEELATRFRVPLTALRHPVVRALSRGRLAGPNAEPWVVRAASDDEAATWLRTVGATQAVVVPIVIDGVSVGCLYGDVVAGALPTDTATHSYFARLRDAATQAIVRRRQRGGTDTPGRGMRAVPAARTTPSSVTPSATPAVTPPEAAARQAAVLRVLRGAPLAEVAAEVGVAPAVLEEWQARFLAGALAGLAEG